MKKLKIVPVLGALILILSCNNNGSKKKDSPGDTLLKKEKGVDQAPCTFSPVTYPSQPCTNAGGGNLVIDPKDAAEFIADFKTRYHDSNPDLELRYWVDSCLIGALTDFFAENINYDGAWVTFENGDLAPYNTGIYFVPTNWENSSGRHIPDWDVVENIRPANCSGTRYLSTDPARSRNFRQFHRHEGTPGINNYLSRKIWIDKCVFKSLRVIIAAHRSSSTPLNGVHIYSASYNKTPSTIPRGYVQNQAQSTIVIVPTYTCSVSTENWDAWDINSYYYQNYLNLKKKDATVPAYNHGELCPNACLDTEDL